MNPIVCQLATVAIAALYCTWRMHHRGLLRKERLMRERVTWMLWVMAQRNEGPKPSMGA